MKRVVVVAVLATLSAGGSAAAPPRQPAAPTLLTTHSRITQFARDGRWLAWTTVHKGYERRLHLRSLRTDQKVRVEQVDYDIDSGDGTLALAGSRAAWAYVTGQGHTETDFEIDTADAGNTKTRTVREMAMHDPYASLPPLAGRASVLVYFRHDGDPDFEKVVTSVERIVHGRPKRVFRTSEVSYLAVDRGRIATARRDVIRGDACNCNFNPAWSPGGDRIAFVSGRIAGYEEDASADIYISNLDGSDRTRVTSDGNPKLGVTWSPDGTRLAFGYLDSGYGPQVAVVNVDGSNPHDVGFGDYPAWSPDGTRLAFGADGGVVVANPDGSGVRDVAAGVRPVWSPDGSRLAFENNGAVYSSHLDGGDVKLVAKGLTAPTWSPDGNAIAGVSRKGISIVHADGTGRTVLAGTAPGDDDPSWSPDGKRVLFDSLANDLDADHLPDPEIYVVAADGNGDPLPVAYGIRDDVNSNVQVHNIYGRLLSVEALNGIPLGLALDGHYAAVLTQATRSTQRRLYYVRARTGEELRSVQVPSSARGPLSASGGRVVFAAGRTIRIGEIRSGQVRVLAHAGGPIVGVAINGRNVTWAENTGKNSGRIRTLRLPR